MPVEIVGTGNGKAVYGPPASSKWPFRVSFATSCLVKRGLSQTQTCPFDVVKAVIKHRKDR